MRVLIAGFGNIFFRDDGFGNEAARALLEYPLPPDICVTDFGIRGTHAAFEMLEGYDVVIFLDAMARGEQPGTLCVIEPSCVPASAPDAHAMELHNALAFYESLCQKLQPAKRPCVLIVGCEPESIDEGMGLSDAVQRAIPHAVAVVYSIIEQFGIGAKDEIEIST